MSNYQRSSIFNFKVQNLKPPGDSQQSLAKKLILKSGLISASHFIQISHVRRGKLVKSLGQGTSLAEINWNQLFPSVCFAMLGKEESILNISFTQVSLGHFIYLADITARSPSLCPSPGILDMRKV